MFVHAKIRKVVTPQPLTKGTGADEHSIHCVGAGSAIQARVGVTRDDDCLTEQVSETEKDKNLPYLESVT